MTAPAVRLISQHHIPRSALPVFHSTAQCSTLTGRRKHRVWQPQIAEPLLGDVTVILVQPRKPISIGTAARALSSFECLDLRLVAPRCDHLARSGRNGSKGACEECVHPASRVA